MAEIDYRALLLRDEDEKQKPPIEKEVDDGVDYRALLGGDSPTITQQGYTPFGRIQENMEWDKLHEQDDWIRASQHFFNMTYGYVPAKGDSELEGYSGSTYREKLADYGLKQMAGFNFNIGDMAIDTSRIFKADQATKESFVYMLDQYDATNTSWHTASQAGWEMFTDATNWVGAITLGSAAVAGQAGRLVGKQLVKETIQASLKNATKKTAQAAAKVGINTSVKRAGAVAGAEGMAHAMTADALEQNVRIDAGQQEAYSYGQTALMGGVGLVGGVVLGSALDYGISKVANKYFDPKVAQQVQADDEKAIRNQIMAERRLAEARTEAGIVTRAIDDELPASEVNKIITDEVDQAKAVDLEADKPEAEVSWVAPKLPSHLKGSKPTYNYGSRSIGLDFEDDVARVLYQMGAKTKSKHYKEYREFLEKAGVDDIDGQATEIRTGIKAKARAGDDNIKVTYRKPETVTKQKAKAKVKKDTSDPRPPKAQLFKHMFKHAYNIFEDVRTNPNKAVERIVEAFEKDQYSPTEFSDILRQINASAELARFDVDRINGLMLKDNISAADLSVLKGDLLSASTTARQLAIVKDYANSYSGRNLQEIQDFMVYRERLAEEAGESFNYKTMVEDAKKKVYNRKLKKIYEEWDAKINKALKDPKDGMAKAREVRAERERDPNLKYVLEVMADNDIKRLVGVKPKSKLDEKFLEASISGVFSIPTLVYNTTWPAIKVAFYPMLDTIMNDPLNRMAWRKNLMIYAQMKGAMDAAWVSAKASARYEQTFLTADMSRILEGGVKIDNLFGSAGAASFLRIFPRLVSGSDAYQQEVAATAVLTARGFDKLVTTGTERGLKGKKLIAFIDDNIQTEINKGYDFHLTEQKLKPIYELGARLGKAGEELEDFVQAEVDKLGAGAFKTLGDDVTVKDLRTKVKELLSEGTEESHNLAQVLAKEADGIEETGQEALESVRTLLYKREFNRKGSMFERAAAGYEDWTRDRAWSRGIGNLFFRTPAWLFHESMRLTPAINALLPTMRNDLSGVNGIARQTRAKTETAVAYAWMLYVVTKYATGEISGSSNVDYTKTGEKNTSTLRPLTIKDPFFFDGGKEVSFARWEPLRIPTTIIVNALDGYTEYQTKLNMNGVSPEDEGVLPDEVMATFGVAFATAISAFRDSALTQGVTSTIGMGVRVAGFMESPDESDKEKGGKVFTNWAVDKALQMVPSSLKKFNEALHGHAPIVQPNNYMDKIIASVNPYATSLPRRYDALGWPMEREITYNQITGFGAAYPDDLAHGRSKKTMEVLDYLAKLEELKFGNFTRQKTRDDRFPNRDLREIDINYEGNTIPLFNAMMRELSKDKVLLADLYYLANADELPLGSPMNRKAHGYRVKMTRQRLSEARSRALDEVIRRDEGLTQQTQELEHLQLLLKSGFSTDRGNIDLTGT